MKIVEYIEALSEQGRHYFTLDEAIAAVEKSRILTLAAIRRLIKKGQVALPYKGFYLIVPPNYRAFGCLPAEQFIPDLMNHLAIPYYVGLLSAAQYYGAAHQKPQQFQVVTQNYLPPLSCGRIYVVFIMNQGIANVPTRQVNTATGYLTLSSPEATAIELMQYPRRSGGLNNITTVLIELVESMSLQDFELCLQSIKVETVTLQRLGYCFDFIDETKYSELIHKHLESINLRTRPLVAGISTKQAERNKKWELYINFNVEPDL